jgi:hypothetical protein
VKCKYQRFIFQQYSAGLAGERAPFYCHFSHFSRSFCCKLANAFSFSSSVKGNNSPAPGGNCKNINVKRGVSAAFVMFD